jgi:type 1 fimbriae regulatory protein FimB/type 1 fimbriae regulatory protein FimE
VAEKAHPAEKLIRVVCPKFTTAGYRKMIARLGEAARFSFPVRPHMFRHPCGYKLANDGRDTRALQHYLGNKSIQHTVRYTKLSPDRFRDFWRRPSGQRTRTAS